jgi:hypothetical protein
VSASAAADVYSVRLLLVLAEGGRAAARVAAKGATEKRKFTHQGAMSTYIFYV